MAAEVARLQPKPVRGPQRYKVQFTASAEHVELLERAQALLSSSSEGAALARVYERALRELVTTLEKRKDAVGVRARRQAEGVGQPKGAERAEGVDGVQRTDASQDVPTTESVTEPRSRYIPAAVRREVFERDLARCTFVDSTGQRCCETHCLELHHLHAFAQGGEHHSSNLTLRCRAHNALAAEEDFGREFVEQKRELGHEPFRAG